MTKATLLTDCCDSGGARTSRQPSFPGQKIFKSGHRVHFFSQKGWWPFLVVALKTQAANAANCFTTVKIKQKRPDIVTFLFSVHYYRSKPISRAKPGRWIFALWCSAACSRHSIAMKKTRNSSGDEISNVNFLYDDIVRALGLDSCINSATGRYLQRRFTKFSEITQYNGHYTVQGHSRTPILVPIESSYRLPIGD